MDRKQFEAKIVAKAWKDEKFREALKADPRGTLAAELQAIHSAAKLPENLKVTVVEESPDHIYLVIPNRPAGVSGALDEASLEAVAGGAAQATTTPSADIEIEVCLNVFTEVNEVVQVVASGPVLR